MEYYDLIKKIKDLELVLFIDELDVVYYLQRTLSISKIFVCLLSTTYYKAIESYQKPVIVSIIMFFNNTCMIISVHFTLIIYLWILIGSATRPFKETKRYLLFNHPLLLIALFTFILLLYII